MGTQDEWPTWVLETDEEFTSGVEEYKGWNPPYQVGCIPTDVENNNRFNFLRIDHYNTSIETQIHNGPGIDNLISWSSTATNSVYEVNLYNVEGFYKLRIELYPNNKVRFYINDQFR